MVTPPASPRPRTRPASRLPTPRRTAIPSPRPTPSTPSARSRQLATPPRRSHLPSPRRPTSSIPRPTTSALPSPHRQIPTVSPHRPSTIPSPRRPGVAPSPHRSSALPSPRRAVQPGRRASNSATATRRVSGANRRVSNPPVAKQGRWEKREDRPIGRGQGRLGKREASPIRGRTRVSYRTNARGNTGGRGEGGRIVLRAKDTSVGAPDKLETKPRKEISREEVRNVSLENVARDENTREGVREGVTFKNTRETGISKGLKTGLPDRGTGPLVGTAGRPKLVASPYARRVSGGRMERDREPRRLGAQNSLQELRADRRGSGQSALESFRAVRRASMESNGEEEAPKAGRKRASERFSEADINLDNVRKLRMSLGRRRSIGIHEDKSKIEPPKLRRRTGGGEIAIGGRENGKENVTTGSATVIGLGGLGSAGRLVVEGEGLGEGRTPLGLRNDGPEVLSDNTMKRQEQVGGMLRGIVKMSGTTPGGGGMEEEPIQPRRTSLVPEFDEEDGWEKEDVEDLSAF